MPFLPSSSAPIVLVEPEEKYRCPLHPPKLSKPCSLSIVESLSERAAYAAAFSKAKAHLTDGRLKKVVLSRRLHVECAGMSDNETLFLRACHNRPNSFVVLWSTPQTGTWLIATPEPLLRKNGDTFATVALAGTQLVDSTANWNEKNKREQEVVAQFVEQVVSKESTSVQRSECHTLRYGNLQHLCTDFSFTLRSEKNVCHLLQGLHPTPAVCGLPQSEALHTIIQSECAPRKYYAGFSGPFLLEGETQLFVSLRCMQISVAQATLYAGGGIMPESVEQEEWEETCRKLETMLEVLRG